MKNQLKLAPKSTDGKNWCVTNWTENKTLDDFINDTKKWPPEEIEDYPEPDLEDIPEELNDWRVQDAEDTEDYLLMIAFELPDNEDRSDNHDGSKSKRRDNER